MNKIEVYKVKFETFKTPLDRSYKVFIMKVGSPNFSGNKKIFPKPNRGKIFVLYSGIINHLFNFFHFLRVFPLISSFARVKLYNGDPGRGIYEFSLSDSIFHHLLKVLYINNESFLKTSLTFVPILAEVSKYS